ncbi:MAG TPA: hypothetical protein VJR71_05065, partial [Pseudolabrys sp.]|nr:hypothetical protein [Pseudolabrys sp.]
VGSIGCSNTAPELKNLELPLHCTPCVNGLISDRVRLPGDRRRFSSVCEMEPTRGLVPESEEA